MGAMWQQAFGPMVKISYDNLEWKTFLDRVNHGQFEVVSMGWSADFNDPATFLGIMRCSDGNNSAGWCDPAFDKLLDDARATNNEKRRIKDYQQAEAIIERQFPMTGIYGSGGNKLVKSYVGGYSFNPMGMRYSKDLYIKAHS